MVKALETETTAGEEDMEAKPLDQLDGGGNASTEDENEEGDKNDKERDTDSQQQKGGSKTTGK